MNGLAAATIVAKNALPYARVLAASFARHHPGVPFFVLLADEIDGCFDPAREPFRLLTLDDLRVPDLHAMRFRYDAQELTYAMTPYLLSALLDRGFDRVAFFKQESLVTGDLTSVLDLISHASIVLTPHLVTPLHGPDRVDRERNILQSGVYNVGFLGVAAAPQARAFLGWWEARMERHCIRDVPRGLHFEQRWLDLVPSYFDDFAFVRDPRFNVAHWNLPERDGATTFVRFSGFDPDTPDALTRYTPRLHLADVPHVAPLFREYVTLLREAGYDEARSWPYAYATLADGTPIPYAARVLYRQLSDERLRAFGDPWRAPGDNAFYAWFVRRQRWHWLRRIARKILRH